MIILLTIVGILVYVGVGKVTFDFFNDEFPKDTRVISLGIIWPLTWMVVIILTILHILFAWDE